MSEFARLAIELRQVINASDGDTPPSWVVSMERWAKIQNDPDYAICRQVKGEEQDVFMGVKIIAV